MNSNKFPGGIFGMAPAPQFNRTLAYDGSRTECAGCGTWAITQSSPKFFTRKNRPSPAVNSNIPSRERFVFVEVPNDAGGSGQTVLHGKFVAHVPILR